MSLYKGTTKIAGGVVSNYPIGSYFYSSNGGENPSSLFGGTWVEDRTYYGGELLAYGLVAAATGSYITVGTDTAFSDSTVGSKSYNDVNYISGILTGTSGCISIQTLGIVGMVEANCYISGLGATGISGLFWKGNYNSLPTGVTLFDNGLNCLLTGPIGATYGGNTNGYIYKVDTTSDVQFFVNPMFAPYNGAITPSVSGIRSHLLVKVFAKYGTTYSWKRTA